jgi:hypothetical protein
MTRADVAALLRQGQMRNMSAHVTGLLVQADGCFLQYLEGPAAALGPLIGGIRADGRHEEVVTLLHRPVDQRLFAGWSLSFSDLNGIPGRLATGDSLLAQLTAASALEIEQGHLVETAQRFWSDCAQLLPA